MRTEPVTAKGIETKARIVRATKAVYEKVGRDRLDTQLVADEAGVSIGTLYRYFEDRVDLLDHAVPNRDRELLDKFLGRLKDIKRTRVWLSDDVDADSYLYADEVDELVQEFSSPPAQEESVTYYYAEQEASGPADLRVHFAPEFPMTDAIMRGFINGKPATFGPVEAIEQSTSFLKTQRPTGAHFDI